MKILFITPKIPYPPIDGHKKSMWGVIKYLSLREHEIKIVCYGQNENYDKIKNEILKYAGCTVLKIQTRNSIQGVLKNFFSRVPYNLSKYKRKELGEYLSDHLSLEKYDIIHVTNSHMGWVIDVVKKHSSAPIVLRQENLELMIMQRYYLNQKNIMLKSYAFLQFKKFLKYEPGLCSKFDLCFMMSQEDEGHLKELNPNVKTSVIPLGIEEELLEIKKNETIPFSIVHIGSLKWYPNLDGFIWFINEILPIVLQSCPEAKLFLYGGGLPESIVLPPNISDHVIVKGFVEDIWEELKDKSLAVIPLRIGSGIRVKLLEMLAVGMNIISTSLGKEGINVIDGHELLVADSSKDFAEKIINFFTNSYDAERISNSGRKFVAENFLWEKISEKFEQEYLKLIDIKTK